MFPNDIDACGQVISFSIFVALLHKISRIKPRISTSKRDSKQGGTAEDVFEQWVTELRRRSIHPTPEIAPAVFRLLFPEEDKQRKYQLQETALGRDLADVLGVSSHHQHRGERLRKWKTNNTDGCLGKEVFELLNESSNNAHDESPLTILEVDALLSDLASLSPYSDASFREKSSIKPRRSHKDILRALYSQMPPLDAAFLTQIILKDLRPLLYPLSDTRTTASLIHFKSNAVTQLSKEDAMRVWDGSGRMRRAFSTRASLQEAATFISTTGQDVEPEYTIGTPIEIPKCRKGQGCKASLSAFSSCSRVWAETKYDGERAQIHVQVDETGAVDIKIFSKSTRDSTNDRYAVHDVIKDALGLTSNHNRTHGASMNTRRIRHNVVVEAEMVAFSTELNRVDEFWRIRSLIESTAKGIRGRHYKPAIVASHESQVSMISNASDGGARHLALVFFDVLMVDSKPLLNKTYNHRRAMLEEIISPIPGHSILAQRYPIELKGRAGLAGGEAELRKLFATHIADCEEGLVLKADESYYRDFRLPWIKLKSDYIPGHGDCLDLVIVGAGWDKDRARELRVAPITLTTFYVGILNEKKSKPNNPHFEVYFTISYGLGREQLEEENFYFSASTHFRYDDLQDESTLPYTFTLFSGLEPPTIMLEEPVLAEAYGAGFTKADNNKYYELRWPRLTKIHRLCERAWTEGITLDKLRETANTAVGRVSSSRSAEEEIFELWTKSRSKSRRSPQERTRLIAGWIAKMEKHDGVFPLSGTLVSGPKANVASYVEADAASMTSRSTASQLSATTGRRNQENALPRTPPSVASIPVYSESSPKRRYHSTTPAKRRRIADSSRPSEHARGHEKSPVTLSPVRGPLSNRIMALRPARPAAVGANTASSRESCSSGEVPYSEPLPYSSVTASGSKTSSSMISHLDNLSTLNPADNPSPPQTLTLDSGPTSRLVSFLQDSLVWTAELSDSTRPFWCRPFSTIVPDTSRIHSLDSFLIGCGWRDAQNSDDILIRQICRGVILFDDTNTSRKDEHADLVKMLEKNKDKAKTRRKPLWIFDLRMMRYGELERYQGDFKRYLLRTIE